MNAKAKAPIPMRDGASVGMTEAHEWSDERATQKKNREMKKKKSIFMNEFSNTVESTFIGRFFFCLLLNVVVVVDNRAALRNKIKIYI